MKSRPYVLAETHWKYVKEGNYNVAVLPWGATEAHNYHLPFGTDIFESDYIAAESARLAWDRGAKIIVLPTVPYGVNTGQIDIKLTINMNPSTQFALLRDVVDSLSRHKITKLLLLNSHGGNDFRQMIRELYLQFPSVFICTTNWWTILDGKKFFDEPGDHAGELETAVMFQIAPHLVLSLDDAGTGAVKNFTLKAIREKWVWAQREWSKVTFDTGVGNPKRATPEKGSRFLSALTQAIADFLTELASADLKNLYE